MLSAALLFSLKQNLVLISSCLALYVGLQRCRMRTGLSGEGGGQDQDPGFCSRGVSKQESRASPLTAPKVLAAAWQG